MSVEATIMPFSVTPPVISRCDHNDFIYVGGIFESPERTGRVLVVGKILKGDPSLQCQAVAGSKEDPIPRDLVNFGKAYNAVFPPSLAERRKYLPRPRQEPV